MKRLAVALLSLLLIAGLIPSLALAHRVNITDPSNPTGSIGLAEGGFHPAAAIDTVWYGFLPGGTGGNGAKKNGVGGIWDFDSDSLAAFVPTVANGMTFDAAHQIGDPNTGTAAQQYQKNYAALQGWTPSLSEVQLQAFDPDAASCEPDTYLNYGNRGQFWHNVNFTTVANRTGSAGTMSNIGGTGSLWCGADAATASNTFFEFEGDEGTLCAVNFPGYANLWDQLVWKDLALSAGTHTMTFDYAVDMDLGSQVGTGTCGASPPMQNGSLTDRLDAYVGQPIIVPAPGSNSELGDIIDLTTPGTTFNQLSPGAGYTGTSGADPLSGKITITTANWTIGGSTARVVFRVRTNRDNSDQTGTVNGNAGSNFGAAAIDNVYFTNAVGKTGGVADPSGSDGHNAASAYTFDSGMQGWVASAKALPLFAHIINVGNNDNTVNGLLYSPTDQDNKYADPCGWPGKSTVVCNLKNNVMATFSPIIEGGHKDHYSTSNWPVCCPRGETCQGAVSPIMDVRDPASGFTVPYGRSGATLQYDVYAYNPLTEAVLYEQFVRYKTATAQVGAGGLACPNFQSWRWLNTQFYTPAARCITTNVDVSAIANPSNSTFTQIFFSAVGLCWELGTAGLSGTCTANFSPLWDNIQYGLINKPDAPAFTQDPWENWQEGYPQDGTVPGGKNYWPMQKRLGNTDGTPDGSTKLNSAPYLKTQSVAVGGCSGIDGKTFVWAENLNKASGPLVKPFDGYFQGDSCNIRASQSGRGTRVDCLFQVIPGPCTDVTNSWFSSFKANTGTFGTGSYGTGAPTAANITTEQTYWTGVNNGFLATSVNETPAQLLTNSAGSGLTYGKHGAGGAGDAWRWYIWNDVRCDTGESDRWDSTATVVSVKKSGTFWSATYQETDPHFPVNGVYHTLPTVNSSSFAWILATSPIVTREHTPIFPSYVFTPGTTVNLMFRSCFNDNPANFQLFPDTTSIPVGTQLTVGGKTLHERILPNAWNDFATYGANTYTGEVGKGRACVLFVDHTFGKGAGHLAWHYTMDSLGIINDEMLIEATSSSTGSFGGGALDLVKPGWQNYGSSGPSLSQIAGYNSIYYDASNSNTTAISDATQNDPSGDIQLVQSWLNNATSASNRLLWLSGTQMADNIDIYLAQKKASAPAASFLGTLGIQPNTTDDNSTTLNYRSITNDNTECPTINVSGAPWTTYGAQQISVVFNFCQLNYDMLQPNTGAGAYASQLWPVASPTSFIQATGVVHDFTAPIGAGRAVAFTDALDFYRIRNLSCHDNQGRRYQMSVVYKQLGANGSTPFCNHNYAPTAVNPGTSHGFVTALFQNTPNPFRPTRATSIHYSVARTSPVTLHIHDVTGRLVRVLVDGKKEAGDYTASFDGRDNNGRSLAAGVYFYRLKVGDYESNKKMLMLK